MEDVSFLGLVSAGSKEGKVEGCEAAAGAVGLLPEGSSRRF